MFREWRCLTKGRWWVPLLKLTSMDITTSQPESFLYSPFKPTELWLAQKWESESQTIILLSVCVCVCVCERERERETRKRGRDSFGNLKIGGGAGTTTWTMCFKLLLVKVSQMFVYKYSQIEHFSCFFFFRIKISKFLKTHM